MARSIDRNSTITAAHDAAIRWLAENPGALADYVGEWVAVADDRVVAHGASMVDVEDDAVRQGFDDPLLVPVMPDSFVGR